MKLMIDTNILLDVLSERKPHFEHSLQIWRLCELGKAQGLVSTLTFANIVYVMRKELDAQKISECWEKLSRLFAFVDLLALDISVATEIQEKDFEDALQSAMAARLKADYIITRNKKDFTNSAIPAVTPMEFLAVFPTAPISEP